jgi:hypothetical protein
MFSRDLLEGGYADQFVRSSLDGFKGTREQCMKSLRFFANGQVGRPMRLASMQAAANGLGLGTIPDDAEGDRDFAEAILSLLD